MTTHESLDCREIFSLLSEYLDADLPPATCEEIARHIADCPPCVEFVDSLKKSIALCRGQQLAEKPPVLSDSAREQMRTAWQRVLAAREPNSGRQTGTGQ